ncbi:hypothetical protein PIB30_024184 [Stylosanthes scabra]|uniref:Uncharacterized protein n=1 Tax=Stylosanthes scabra TaxID=79078 RepID=A0ABU6Z790_9FABA|nr:hypothetical protein [Stylosanthes scabra]
MFSASSGIPCLIPAGIRCNFRPTRAMALTKEECQICLYVFDPDLDLREVLIKDELIRTTRMELHCMQPGSEVDWNIIMWKALKLSHGQPMSANITYWFMPPEFGV